MKVLAVFKMKLNVQVIEDSRKIIKSWLGIILSCIHTAIFATSIGFAIFFGIEMPSSGLKTLGATEGLICWTIGLVPRILEGHGRAYSLMALGFYVIACLLQMYIPLRALIQPSFLAGKPSIRVRIRVFI